MPIQSSADVLLPAPLTSFVGRHLEIEEIVQLLGAARSVTLTGPGGIGKTRLALEVARAVAAAGPAAIHWAELAPLDGPGLLVQHIAAQLAVREQPDISALDALAGMLGKQEHLLVLDNCEHVVEAAAELAGLLLRRCSGLRILATSREALGVEGEHAWLVRGLTVGTAHSADQVEMSDAERLFAERARAASSSFDLTAENLETVRRICRRLDGLPLAIELAAARVPVLGPGQIAERLDDAFRVLSGGHRSALPRHRTLRATVDWSHRLLSPPEQLLLDRLSVFSGSFTLRAVEIVCAGDGLPDEDVLDTLGSLVSRSLVVMREHEGTARYHLLEIVRQYARERLVTEPEAVRTLGRRHAEYYADLAERALPDLERHHSADWAALPLELDNLRVATQWSFANGEDRLGHRLTGALWWYWGRSGQWSEGSLWLDEAVRHVDPVEGAEWGQVLNGAGTWAYLGGDTDRARTLLLEAVRILGAGGDRLHQAMALSTLAHMCCTIGDVDTAIRYGREAVDIARTVDESYPRTHALTSGLGFALSTRGDHDLASDCYEEAFDAAVRDGHHWGIAEAARARAEVALDGKGPDAAAGHLRVAIASALAIHDPFQCARILALAMWILARDEQCLAVAGLWGALDARRASGTLMLPRDADFQERAADEARRVLGNDAFVAEATTGSTWSLPDALRRADDELRRLGAQHDGTERVAPWSAAEPPAHPAPVTTGAPQAPVLKVRALGGFEAWVDGELAASEAWSHARPRELLVYLLCHPAGRTKEEVGLAFWPDASSAQVKNSFHVLMHRLRKAVGRSELIAYEGERYRVDPELSWFDVSTFEEEITASIRDERRSGPDIVRLKAALELYRGDFMQGEVVGDWSLAVQDRTRRLYCDGLRALAHVQLEGEDLSAAADTLEQLVATEELHEEAYRLLMTCLARLGRRDRALLHYRKLSTLLRDELGTAPEPETEELVQRLQRAEPV